MTRIAVSPQFCFVIPQGFQLLPERLRVIRFYIKIKIAVSPLHTSLQVANFQRWQCALACPVKLVHMSGVHCHMRASSTSGCVFVYFTVLYRVQYRTLYSICTVVQNLYFKPRMSGSKHKSSGDVAPACLSAQSQRLDASCCTVLLYFSRYCTVRLKMFYFWCLFFIYYLCEEYYKPITVQCCIADCVSWVPRLILLDLQTNWIYERNLFVCRGLNCIHRYH